ncbi:4Fe-4S dicluster domain-containing protein [Lachnospiraceae bacterium XBB1006]|nr:4Fe-4S dicluster domain-containing protein [Lachnospiraceae bacterium XBB1006]
MRKANVNKKRCVACGECAYTCPKTAITVKNGCFAIVDAALCVGCGLCAKACPADCIDIMEEVHHEK